MRDTQRSVLRRQVSRAGRKNEGCAVAGIVQSSRQCIRGYGGRDRIWEMQRRGILRRCAEISAEI